jgi:hypothetical protein
MADHQTRETGEFCAPESGEIPTAVDKHLQGFLLRHGRIHPGKKGWTKPYRRWLATVRFEHPAQQIVLQDYVHVSGALDN